MRRAALALMAALAALACPAQAADGFAPGSRCRMAADTGAAIAARAMDPAAWSCGGGAAVDEELSQQAMRYDLDSVRPAPRYAEFERHGFAAVTVVAVGRDGSTRSLRREFARVPLGASSLRSIVPIPEFDAPAAAVILILEDTRFPGALEAAELRAVPSVLPAAGMPHLWAALLCGLLLAPMLFDLGYWRALRESFPLSHALFCIMAFVQTAAVSGLIPLVTRLPFATEMTITYLSLDAMIAATFLFAYHFLERGTLDRRHRALIAGLGAVTIVNGLVTTLWAEAIGPFVDHIYLGVMMATLACYFGVLFVCWRRGSRAAPFLALGLAPFALVQASQTAVIFGGAGFTFDETWPQNLALLFEVVATAMAVADRFMAVRRERDHALDEARMLSALSERDDLTGLLNRRALDAHYPRLLAEGFTALAVLDIDHFKAINDLHGHPVGDLVLRATAEALRVGEDRDLRAFRIGGEEFLLLLRGNRVEERAEQRRRALSGRIAAEVPALEGPVTASMGLVDFGEIAGDGSADFAMLYSRADWLLYEAKRLGRNRTLTESLALFDREAEPAWPAQARRA